MDVQTRPAVRPLLVDKDELRLVVREQYAKLGITPDPTATAERARAMMLADGIRPDDNVFSRGIIAMREEKIRVRTRRNSPQRELPLDDDAP